MSQQKPKRHDRHLDLLLISIIRAYDHPDKKSEEDRLETVREALLGEKRTRGRTPSFDDLALFKIIDELRRPEMAGLRKAIGKVNKEPQTPEWKAEIERDPLAIREAARKFGYLAGPAASDESREDRLRRKARDGIPTREMSKIEALFDPTSPRTRTIITILGLLESLGVRSETIWDEDT